LIRVDYQKVHDEYLSTYQGNVKEYNQASNDQWKIMFTRIELDWLIYQLAICLPQAFTDA